MKQTTRRGLQAETRRNQLLDIALALFAERGVENVSIKDLATEANVAQGLIYYYFQSKDELLAAVFQRHNPLPQLQAIIETLDDLPAREGFLLFARRAAALLPEKRPVLRLLARELLSPRSSLLAQALPYAGRGGDTAGTVSPASNCCWRTQIASATYPDPPAHK